MPHHGWKLFFVVNFIINCHKNKDKYIHSWLNKRKKLTMLDQFVELKYFMVCNKSLWNNFMQSVTTVNLFLLANFHSTWYQIKFDNIETNSRWKDEYINQFSSIFVQIFFLFYDSFHMRAQVRRRKILLYVRSAQFSL